MGRNIMSQDRDRLLASLNEAIALVVEQQLEPLRRDLAAARARADELLVRCAELNQRIEELQQTERPA